MYSEETIAAIATPLGTGGIGVVRISGLHAFKIADRLFSGVSGRPVSEMKGYTCAYGRVFDSQGDIDEAVLTVFRAPYSYTGEDVVEISSHGGVYIVGQILRACLENGARAALPGEFTKRAFLNGKLDLTRAEAVADLIAAQGRQAARAALTARDGALYRRADEICAQLLEQASHLAAWMDYPEEDIFPVQRADLHRALIAASEQLEQLLAGYDTGRMVREGIDTVIAGRPNVGKSTLMNLLAGYGRSIVTDLPGTTRDIVTDTVRLGELVLHLSDTAGIRSSDDPVEQAGVALAVDKLERAQLILAVFDGSQPLSCDDYKVIDRCKDTLCIALVNKNDLEQRLEMDVIKKAFTHVISFSAKSRDGADKLEQKIGELLSLDRFDSSAAMLANERQRAAVLAAAAGAREAADALHAGVSYDAVCVCVEEAAGHLLELTGKVASQEVVDQVFSRFCVGK